MEDLYGFIERITYQNPDNGFTVAKLKPPKKGDITCLVGYMPSIQVGEALSCKGNWKRDPVHGIQFQVEEFTVSMPQDLKGIEKYLGSGLFKGIGATYAKKIVSHFKEKTLDTLNNAPESLRSVPGIGEKRLKKFIQSWQEQVYVRDVMIFLRGIGVGASLAQKIYRSYGNESIQLLQENPYRLSQDLFGVGFKTADKLAQELGIAKDASERIDAAISYILSECASDGHTCFPQNELIISLEKLLDIPPSHFPPRLIRLEDHGKIMRMSKTIQGELKLFVWQKPLCMAEKGIANHLLRLKNGASTLRSIDTDKAISWVEKKEKIELDSIQKEAISNALKEKIFIITGGPGTGKSTITKSLLSILSYITKKTKLVAPTGRAAKRLSEITKMPASTIHALLEVDFSNGGFKHNTDNLLDCDQIIIDEASMIDTYLMLNLLKALPQKTRVLFIGDINQLPSVGAGSVLKDLIESKIFATKTLNKIYRQAAGSQIIINSHKINQGQFPDLKKDPDSDFFFLEEEDPEKIILTIKSLVSVRLPRKYGFHPLEDIQVLAPMKKGSIGTENLNLALQDTLNQKPLSLMRNGRRYIVGDKVMQMRNNYQKEVFNGDIGIIEDINMVDQEMMVKFSDRSIVYEFSETNELILAYAVSVHKFQGSECPCIIVPVHTAHFKLLHRNLLYTAITRGKKLVILIGTKKALAICVRNTDSKERYTGLKESLFEAHTPSLGVS